MGVLLTQVTNNYVIFQKCTPLFIYLLLIRIFCSPVNIDVSLQKMNNGTDAYQRARFLLNNINDYCHLLLHTLYPSDFYNTVLFWLPSTFHPQISDHSFSVFFTGSPSPSRKVIPQDSIFRQFPFSLCQYFPLSSSSLRFSTVKYRLITQKSTVLLQISSGSHTLSIYSSIDRHLSHPVFGY